MLGISLAVRRVSQGRIIIVLFWTKYAVTRQIKSGIFKLTTRRGQRNLLTVFIFVSCKEKGCYLIVSLGHQNFDCRLYCGLSRHMQGREHYKTSSHNVFFENIFIALPQIFFLAWTPPPHPQWKFYFSTILSFKVHMTRRIRHLKNTLI